MRQAALIPQGNFVSNAPAWLKMLGAVACVTMGSSTLLSCANGTGFTGFTGQSQWNVPYPSIQKSESQLCDGHFWHSAAGLHGNDLVDAIKNAATEYSSATDACAVLVEHEEKSAGPISILLGTPAPSAAKKLQLVRAAIDNGVPANGALNVIHPIESATKNITSGGQLTNNDLALSYLISLAGKTLNFNTYQAIPWPALAVAGEKYVREFVAAGFDPNAPTKRIVRTGFEAGTDGFLLHEGAALHQVAADPSGGVDAVGNLMSAGARNIFAYYGSEQHKQNIKPSALAIALSKGQAGDEKVKRINVADAISGGEVQMTNTRKKTKDTPAKGDRASEAKTAEQNKKPDVATRSATRRALPVRTGCSKAELDAEAGTYIASLGSPPSGVGTQLRWQKATFGKIKRLYETQQKRCPSVDLSQAISIMNQYIESTDQSLRAAGVR